MDKRSKHELKRKVVDLRVAIALAIKSLEDGADPAQVAAALREELAKRA